jgi:phosphoglycolate phosphatase-like HAD superfamily hydrolase
VPEAAIVDVDGTLVDTNYHHALAWSRAFREHDLTIPLWTLHRHIGMGGDKYVAAVAGAEAERRLGEKLRGRWEVIFGDLLPEIAPLPGARGLLSALRERGLTVILASSSIKSHFDTFLDLLGGRDLVDDWTTKDDVEESKPAPDLVRAALDKAGTDDAMMIGDTPWDVEAARRCGLETIGLLTGGYARAELEEAGAAAVFESPEQLWGELDRALDAAARQHVSSKYR